MMFKLLFLMLALSIGCQKKNSETPTTISTIAELKTLAVSATDSSILFKSSESHIYRECDNNTCIDDILFVFFAGSDGSPSSHQKIADVIGKTGIRVLILAYQNNGTLNTICGTTDSCYTNARQHRVEGAASSSYVSSVADGVKNRLLKSLISLGWTSFYSGSIIHWNKIIFGGFSQGAGVAAWIGKNYSVKRVCQFSGTWDHTTGTTAATWLSSTSQTSSNLFFGFTHQHDSLTNGATYLDLNWQALGMGTGALQLYSSGFSGQKIVTNDTDSNCVSDYHACSVQDSATPLDAAGNPKYAATWKYVCGR